MREPCEYKYKCVEAKSDWLCNEVSDCCRIHKDFKYREKQKAEYEAEIKRLYELNDNGLTRFSGEI